MSGIALETRAAIAELNAQFAWALDRHDYDVLREVFTPEAHYVGSGGDFHGVEAIIASFRARTGTRMTRHGLGNLLLEARDERTVSGLSSWHTFASNVTPPVGIGLALVADFHDVYGQQHGGAWRIEERIIIPVFREPRLAPESPINVVDNEEGRPR